MRYRYQHLHIYDLPRGGYLQIDTAKHPWVVRVAGTTGDVGFIARYSNEAAANDTVLYLSAPTMLADPQIERWVKTSRAHYVVERETETPPGTAAATPTTAVLPSTYPFQ